MTNACRALCAAAALLSPIVISTPLLAQNGIASVYSGGRTANGEYARAGAYTAAHRSLPFGTMVRVTNRKSGRSVVVRINDRGPFIRGRIIDLTPAGARAIGFSGLAPVTLAVLGKGPMLASKGHRKYASKGRMTASKRRVASKGARYVRG